MQTVDVKPGNAMPLERMPVGTIVHNVEMKPRKGGQIARPAGTHSPRRAGWGGGGGDDPPAGLAGAPPGNPGSSDGRPSLGRLRTVPTTRGPTIVLVTHDADLAAIADPRLVLHDGRVTEHVGADRRVV